MALLYDFYTNLLTEKQQDCFDLYYNQDLSLQEISEHLNITRQGVRDNIKRGEKILTDAEDKLGLYQKFYDMRKKFSEINEIIRDIEASDENKLLPRDIKIKINLILTKIAEVNELC